MSWTSKVLILMLICLLAFASACSKSGDSLPPGIITACPSPSPRIANDGKLKLFIPDVRLDELVFHEINERATKAGLSSLRDVALNGEDLEVRVWASFGLNGLGGFFLKRHNSQWTATKLRPMIDSEILTPLEHYPEPKLGWDAFWNNLVSKGLLSLPDDSCFKENFASVDGTAYIVEINLNGIYRTYHCGNPSIRTPEYGYKDQKAMNVAKQMTEIARHIFNESFLAKTK